MRHRHDARLRLERETGAEPLPDGELTYDRVMDRLTELEAEQHDQRRSRTVELRRLEHATRSELETISEDRGRLDTSGGSLGDAMTRG